jgi:hypothetical protein
MTQQQREAVASMLRASPFDPAGDLREQRPLFEKMIAAAPVPADVVTAPGQLGGVPVVYVDIPGTTTGGVILYFPRRVLRHRLGGVLGGPGLRPGAQGAHAGGDRRLPARA